MEAIRTRFDSNRDGVLFAADADFGKFKVMVTNADWTIVVRTTLMRCGHEAYQEENICLGFHPKVAASALTDVEPQDTVNELLTVQRGAESWAALSDMIP